MQKWQNRMLKPLNLLAYCCIKIDRPMLDNFKKIVHNKTVLKDIGDTKISSDILFY